MRLDPALVCIVGPNAAGKSSFIEALESLNDDEEFRTAQRTRATPRPRTVVQATFFLAEDDKVLLQGIPGAAAITRLTVRKESGAGSRTYELVSEPARPRMSRRDCSERLRRLRETAWPDEMNRRDEAESEAQWLGHMIDAALALSERNDELSSDEASTINTLYERVVEVDRLPWPHRGLPPALKHWYDEEMSTHPRDQALHILRGRIPLFLKFDDANRLLSSSYDVIDEEPAPAIENLLKLAGTTWTRTVEVAQSTDAGEKLAFEQAANEALRQSITQDWNQSDVTVQLKLDGSTLSLLMSMSSADYIDITEHSDGLRQFVALRAFMTSKAVTVPPVILIDEAERHLHYDAQADLISVFERQEEAAKVIYTTHSAGCLPHDLGTGIRAVLPILDDAVPPQQTDQSQVVDSIWTHGKGFSPLLLALGASAFAFSALQRAVVTEGLSDALLLPTLIREATRKERLSYQIVPGFSQAPKADADNFDLMAARVAFVADSNLGGRNHITGLVRQGVRREQVAWLGGSGSGDVDLEDLLAIGVYVAAINAELSRWYPGVLISPGDIPAKGRSDAVEAWAKARGANVSKPEVAQRVLDQRGDALLVAGTRRATLRALDTRLESILAAPTHLL